MRIWIGSLIRNGLERQLRVGFDCEDGVSIRECDAAYNGTQGVVVTHHCSVVRTTCRRNGAGYAGLWLNGSGNRAEDNELTENGVGIWISGAKNIVTRNALISNSSTLNSYPANNNVAPVVTNPGANGFATMTAWSNIAH